MSWSKLSPLAKSTGRPMVSASVVVNKAGTAKLSVILSASIHGEYGERTRVEVSAGEGEHAGSLLVEFSEAGAFEIKVFGKGGGRLFLPPFPGTPGLAPNEACTLGDRTADSLVIKLPIETWRRSAALMARPQVPTGGSSVKPPSVGNGASVDMVEYLASKGVKISRLANNRFQMNGETVLLGAVLSTLNSYRKAADLDPLPVSKVW